MDEPTNHLDDVSRGKLYRFITSTSSGMLVVSHDRILLNLLSSTYELTSKGVIYYAGIMTFTKSRRSWPFKHCKPGWKRMGSSYRRHADRHVK